jgi:hypothetical protein
MCSCSYVKVRTIHKDSRMQVMRTKERVPGHIRPVGVYIKAVYPKYMYSTAGVRETTWHQRCFAKSTLFRYTVVDCALVPGIWTY